MAEWAWMYAGSENAHGPFKSREEAIAEARADHGDDPLAEVAVGIVEYPSPRDFAAAVADADEIVEKMDEAISDGVGAFFPGDDPMFEPASCEAEPALKRALGDWAEEHVKRVGSWTLRETDEDTITVGQEDTDLDAPGGDNG